MKQFSGEYKQLVVDMSNAEDLSKHGMMFNEENWFQTMWNIFDRDFQVLSEIIGIQHRTPYRTNAPSCCTHVPA